MSAVGWGGAGLPGSVWLFVEQPATHLMCVVNVLLHSYPTFRMEESERLKARQALLAGALGDKLKLLSKLLVRLRVLGATNPARDPMAAQAQHTESRHCCAAIITAVGLRCAPVTEHEAPPATCCVVCERGFVPLCAALRACAGVACWQVHRR